MEADGVGAQTVSRQWVGDFTEQLNMLGGIEPIAPRPIE